MGLRDNNDKLHKALDKRKMDEFESKYEEMDKKVQQEVDKILKSKINIQFFWLFGVYIHGLEPLFDSKIRVSPSLGLVDSVLGLART